MAAVVGSKQDTNSLQRSRTVVFKPAEEPLANNAVSAASAEVPQRSYDNTGKKVSLPIEVIFGDI